MQSMDWAAGGTAFATWTNRTYLICVVLSLAVAALLPTTSHLPDRYVMIDLCASVAMLRWLWVGFASQAAKEATLSPCSTWTAARCFFCTSPAHWSGRVPVVLHAIDYRSTCLSAGSHSEQESLQALHLTAHMFDKADEQLNKHSSANCQFHAVHVTRNSVVLGIDDGSSHLSKEGSANAAVLCLHCWQSACAVCCLVCACS